jgi:hypothetical protein
LCLLFDGRVVTRVAREPGQQHPQLLNLVLVDAAAQPPT